MSKDIEHLRYAHNLAQLMSTMSPEEVVEVFYFLREEFCPHCGYKQPIGRFCQCQNDE